MLSFIFSGVMASDWNCNFAWYLENVYVLVVRGGEVPCSACNAFIDFVKQNCGEKAYISSYRRSCIEAVKRRLILRHNADRLNCSGPLWPRILNIIYENAISIKAATVVMYHAVSAMLLLFIIFLSSKTAGKRLKSAAVVKYLHRGRKTSPHIAI